jgi:hypothetical protein
MLHDLVLTALDNLTSDKAGEAIPAGPEGFWRLRLPDFMVVRLSALGADRLYPQGSIPGSHFCTRLSRP